MKRVFISVGLGVVLGAPGVWAFADVIEGVSVDAACRLGICTQTSGDGLRNEFMDHSFQESMSGAGKCFSFTLASGTENSSLSVVVRQLFEDVVDAELLVVRVEDERSWSSVELPVLLHDAQRGEDVVGGESVIAYTGLSLALVLIQDGPSNQHEEEYYASLWSR